MFRIRADHFGERDQTAGQSNRSYRVHVHVARATESHNVARMPRGAGTSLCDAHLQQVDDTPRWHRVDLSFLLSDFGWNLVRKMAVSENWLIQI